MEDDDEFGDLYTDVLRPFSSSSSSSAPQLHQPSPAPSSLHRPIDLNLQNDDDDIIYGASHTNSTVPHQTTNQTLVSGHEEPVRVSTIAASGDSGRNLIAGDQREEDLAGASRVLESGDVNSPDMALQGVNYGVESVKEEIGDNKDGDLMDKDVNFDIEEADTGIDDVGMDPIIPGLSGGESVRGSAANQENMDDTRRNDIASGEGDDWDSDSEDDLQIVLNDNNHGPMAMERGGVMGDDDDEDDEDGEPLVIVADGDPNQALEEQEWGEDATQAVDGERKETVDAGKANGGGMAVAPKIGYSNHGYHPFHSQFKYVRPGAAPIPGSAAVGSGAPGQVRPLVNMGPMVGRGRGDWRPAGMKNAPTMQKGFHSGFGIPVWGNNMSGRGFGGGLEFTLPSHKTIFDVDIDSFEEKPWRCPGVDVSDFFNFSLNEESWKYYCKQLEQHRLETTMQSKIRVYESGRTEQEYDPDLPPELAAAAGIQDVPADNANLGKLDIGQSDLSKGSARVRPPIPTGRAIQVEGGYGERLPSIDTRPPRIRDSDAIIEIVLQDSVDDDSSTRNGVLDQTDSDLPREDLRGGHVAEDDIAQVDTEYFDSSPDAYNSQKRELVGRRAPFVNSLPDKIPEGDGILPFPPEAPLKYRSGSRGQTPIYSSGNFGSPHEERWTQGIAQDKSPHLTPSRGTQDKKFLDNPEEESIESMDGKHSPLLSSPVTVRDARELSVDRKDEVHDELILAEGSSVLAKEEMPSNTITTIDTLKDGNLQHSMKKQKLSSRVEQTAIQELDDDDDSKAARSSENSKARSGSSRDNQKWRDSVEEEVIQDGRSTRMRSTKTHLDENEQSFRRKVRDGRQEMERNRTVIKGREDSYSLRGLDPSLPHHLQMKTEGFLRRKERENPDGSWQRRDDDPYTRRSKTEDSRKREDGEEIGSRHRGKVRESERSDKDEQLHSRKQLDNGSFRVHYEKDAGSRHRERDGNLKSRYEMVDDYHSKRRKDEEYLRRDHADKEEILHGHRESTSRRKRERDDVMDPRKRDDQQRIRDNFDDYHSVRHKDEGWLQQRERGERQREREEWHRLKQSHEESLPKREREESRNAVRSGRGSEDKAWVGHARAKDEYKGSDKEYQPKDTVRHGEPLKRRDRIEDENFSHHRGREDVYARGNQFSNEESKSRQERSSARNDRAVNASDNQRVHEKKHKENTRKSKESEGRDHNMLGSFKRNQEDQSGRISEMGLKGTNEQGNGENEISVHRTSSRKHKEDASSDEEQQDSKRGRSKLERWTSHKERDYSINSKSSASLKFKELDRHNNVGPSDSKLPDEPAMEIEPVDNRQPLAEDKDAGDPEIKDADTKPSEEKHLDTVEKLKKRSERFKLPMPSEKDAMVIKKMESEALPSAKSDAPTDSEIKQERPARKRRWISN